MSVLIIDSGLSNLKSVYRAFQECGASVTVSDQVSAIENCDKLVLPGVGAFPDGMANLKELFFVEKLRETASLGKKPILGICLGMQLLFSGSEEVTPTDGLGLLEGQVLSMKNIAPDLRNPHIGWNEVHTVGGNPLLKNIESGTDFYFVHSFYCNPSTESEVVGKTTYGKEYCSVVNSGNIWATQFHPEKSSKPGFQIIKNFLAI